MAPNASKAKRELSVLAFPPLLAAADCLTPAMIAATQAFWEQPIHLHRVGVFKSAATELFLGRRLFVCNHPTYGEGLPHSAPVHIQIKLSHPGCQWLLDSTLGQTAVDIKNPATTSEFTELEQAILTQWCHWVMEPLTAHLPDLQDLNRKPMSGKTVDMVWLLQKEASSSSDNAAAETTYGWMVLSLPYDLLVPWCQTLMVEQAQRHATTLEDATIAQVGIPMTLSLGSGRVPLDDLQQLEAGDVITLESSDIKTITAQLRENSAAQPIEFPIAISWPPVIKHMRQLLLPPSSSSESFADVTAQDASFMPTTPSNTQTTAFWNQVHIDVHAEFMPVRLPLDELKQMSEGLVVDVGSLAQNAIRLHVDGKTVAYGELVIVGDRFGVRIQQLSGGNEAAQPPKISLSASAPTAKTLPAAPKAIAPTAPPPAEAQPNDEEAPASEDTDDEDDW